MQQGRQQHALNGGQTAARRPTRDQAPQGDAAAGPAQPSAAGMTHVSSMQDVGASVMNAVQNIAELTDFQARAAPQARGGVGDAMLERFKKFDAKFLQPAFGRHERMPSEEMANVAIGMVPDAQQGTENPSLGQEPNQPGGSIQDRK